MLLQGLDEVGLVAKVDARDVERSAEWYVQKLGFVVDPRYVVSGWWIQLNIPGVTQCALGLAQAEQPGTFQNNGSSAVTLVVADIESARNALIAESVEVSEIESLPMGVRLCSFVDLDGNSLALRQNAPDQPSPGKLGASA